MKGFYKYFAPNGAMNRKLADRQTYEPMRSFIAGLVLVAAIGSVSFSLRHAFAQSPDELPGLAELKKGDYEGAGRWFDQIAADRETPAGLRQRLEIYVALVAGGPVQVSEATPPAPAAPPPPVLGTTAPETTAPEPAAPETPAPETPAPEATR